MHDPSHVTARIAELMETDRYWADPDALAEAMTPWGTGANEHGVFCRHERIEIARTPHAHAAVLIAEGGNGLFGYGIDHGHQMGGSHCFPCVWREAFDSRDAARTAGVADLLERLGKGGDTSRYAESARRGGYEAELKRCVEAANWVQAQHAVGRNGVGYDHGAPFGRGRGDREAEEEWFDPQREQAGSGASRSPCRGASWSSEHREVRRPGKEARSPILPGFTRTTGNSYTLSLPSRTDGSRRFRQHRQRQQGVALPASFFPSDWHAVCFVIFRRNNRSGLSPRTRPAHPPANPPGSSMKAANLPRLSASSLSPADLDFLWSQVYPFAFAEPDEEGEG